MGTLEMSRNSFFLHIKILELNPETGLFYKPPCEMRPSISINLQSYLEEVVRTKEGNMHVHQEAVSSILTKLYRGFDCPLGWQIEMLEIEINFLNPPEWQIPEVKRAETSKEFCYYPPNGQTVIDLSCIKDFAYAPFKSKEEISFPDDFGEFVEDLGSTVNADAEMDLPLIHEKGEH